MSALRDLVDDYADLGSESDDEDFDEETGEARRPKKRSVDLDDSSEEESEDEEAARAVSLLSVWSDCSLLIAHSDRYKRALSSTKMRTTTRNAIADGEKGRSDDGKSARKKAGWTMKIWTSLERPTRS